MIEITWGTFAAIASFTVVVAPGFYWMGRTAKQVDVNTRAISQIFKKIDEIHLYIKNGRA